MGIIDLDHYSFSRLSSVDECPYSVYLKEVEKIEEEENAFAQNGKLVHEILESWAKGELPKELMSLEYETRYGDEVTKAWPKVFGNDVGKSTFRKVSEYFETFDEFPGYKIVSTEKYFETDIEGRKFVGVIDLILEDENTGAIVILDHKSKSLSAFRKAEKAMYRQPLLYSKYIYETYGKWPDEIAFNLFKENGKIMKKPFSKEDYDEAMNWAIEQIKKIEEYDVIDWFETKENPDMFCNQICSYRFTCPVGMTGSYK